MKQRKQQQTFSMDNINTGTITGYLRDSESKNIDCPIITNKKGKL